MTKNIDNPSQWSITGCITLVILTATACGMIAFDVHPEGAGDIFGHVMQIQLVIVGYVLRAEQEKRKP